MTVDMNFSESSSKVNWPSVIRNFRMSKRLKQAALAEDLGVTQAMVSRWENGESEPPERVKRRLGELVRDAFVIAPAPTWIDLVSLNPACEFVTDSRGLFKALSRGATDMLGLTRGQYEGRSSAQVIGGEFVETMDQLREHGLFRNEIVFAQSLGTMEVNSASGLKTLLVDFIHWPRIEQTRTTYCVHSGVVVSEAEYALRLEERGRKFIYRKSF